MAGGAFDLRQILADHNPLVSGLSQQIRTDPADLAKIAAQFAEAIVDLITQSVINIIKSITGIDLSSLETLIDGNFISQLLSGNFITDLLTGNFVAALFDVIGASGGMPVDLITGLAAAIASAVAGIIQQIIDTIFSGLTGSSNVGNPLSIVGIELSKLMQRINSIDEITDSLWAQVQQIGGVIIKIVTEVESAPLLAPLALAEQFLATIGVWFGQTKQSNSPNNPAVAAMAGRQAALEAAILNGTSTTGFNDHLNRATLGTDYTLLGANSPTMFFDGASDGYLIGGSSISGVHINPSALPMKTDRNRFQWTLRGFEDFGHTGRHRVLICGNSGFTNFLAVEVYHTGFADRIRMFTVTGGTWQSVGTQQTNFTPPHKFRNFDTIDIAYDPVTNTFFLYFNSSPADYFTDSTNIVGHGVGHREVAAVFNFDSDSGATGLGMDDLSIYDYPEIT